MSERTQEGERSGGGACGAASGHRQTVVHVTAGLGANREKVGR